MRQEEILALEDARSPPPAGLAEAASQLNVYIARLAVRHAHQKVFDLSFVDAGTGREEPSGAPQEQAGSADDEEWQATQPHLLPLKAKIVGLRAHLTEMQTQLVAAQQERGQT